MTTQQMEYFLKLAESLSFTAVADYFYITQPTLSRQIINLEQELGVALFIRGHNKVTLTPEGQLFLEGLRPIYDDLQKLRIDMQLFHFTQTTDINIGLQEEQLLDSSIISAIQQLRSKYPDIHIQIQRATSADLYQGLLNGRFDIINTLLFDEFAGDSHIITVPLTEEPSFIALSSTLAQNIPEAFSKEQLCSFLQQHPILLSSPESFIFSETLVAQKLANNLSLPNTDFNVIISGSPLSIPVQVTVGLGITICNATNIMSLEQSIKMIELPFARVYTKGIMYKMVSNNSYLTEFISTIKNFYHIT